MNDQELQQFAESRVGSCLRGKWTLERLLGVGGTASVYSATHRNGNRVAVKILHPELSSQRQFRERFLREGYVGNAIEHSGAVTVHDDDITEDGCACLVMDLLEGENLEARRMRKGGRLACAEVLSLMDDVLDTLAIAHDRGIVHRDIKPENLFLTTHNQVKLLDFGIARIDVPESPGKTLTGIAMGTPAFMPAEQASAHWDKVDAQSDLWAIGATMFTLLTGRFVHEGSTVNESLAMAVTREAPRIENVAPDILPPVAQIVDKALQRDKLMRWSTAVELQKAIRLTYQELQEGGERYSLSAGIAAHSLPPHDAIEQAPAMMGTSTGEPVSAELAVFRPKSHKIWVFAGAISAAAALLAFWFLRGPGAQSSRVMPNGASGTITLSSSAGVKHGTTDVTAVAPASGMDAGRPKVEASDDSAPVTDVDSLTPVAELEPTVAPPAPKVVPRRPKKPKKKPIKKPNQDTPKAPVKPFDPFSQRD